MRRICLFGDIDMKYFSYYDINDKEGRGYCLAATNKMNYICKAIVSQGKTVEIISASIASSKGNFKGGSTKIDQGVTLKKFNAYRWGNAFQKFWVTIYGFFAVFLYFLFHVKKAEKVIVYHSLGYLNAVSWAKFFKRFYLILEVEEIYGDVSGNKKDKKRELAFFKKADAYIFPAERLNETINSRGKPHVIIYGTYNVEEEIGEKCNDGKIHCVYAGTFDPRKGGAWAAVKAGEFLNENYHVHIIGFGSENDKDSLINAINNISKKTKCHITYDGLLAGEEYIRFIQGCHIGLSTQNPEAGFNDTSFPSKVLSYLANGLRVVSIKIPVVVESKIGDILYYYTQQTPEAIALAIKGINIDTEYNSRARIYALDQQFKEEIEKIIN